MWEQALPRADVDALVARARNLYRHLLGGGLADLSRTPSTVIHESPQCIVRHYLPSSDPDPEALPVLLVPPMAAPATSMDLRRDNSLAGFLVERGFPTYVVDYGDLSTRTDADLALDHWIDTVIPTAVHAVSRANDHRPVGLIGYCLGGALALFTHAAHPELPIDRIAAVATPFDFDTLKKFEPIRLLGRITNGRLEDSLFRVLGGVPGRINTLAFKFADPLRLAQKPMFRLQKSDRPDVLAQLEAVDAMMDAMEAYPGRSIGQIYDSFIRTNELKHGRVSISDGRVLSLSDVTVPIMNIAGSADNIFTPVESAHHLVHITPNAESVRLEVAPGGHLGVLTGPRARDTTWQYLDSFLRER